MVLADLCVVSSTYQLYLTAMYRHQFQRFTKIGVVILDMFMHFLNLNLASKQGL